MAVPDDIQNLHDAAQDLSGGLGEDVRLAYIKEARTMYMTDEINIDDDAKLSVGVEVVWVQAWVCVERGEVAADTTYVEDEGR